MSWVNEQTRKILDVLDEYSVEKTAELIKTPVEYVEAIKTSFSEKPQRAEICPTGFYCPECKREVKKNRSHCPACKTKLTWEGIGKRKSKVFV